jgi:hypothetical protein
VQAVKPFEPDRRFRLTTCAMCYGGKAAIHPALVVARKDGHTRARQFWATLSAVGRPAGKGPATLCLHRDGGADDWKSTCDPSSGFPNATQEITHATA